MERSWLPALFAVALAASSCGGGGGSTGPSDSGKAAEPSGATITITSSGVSPKTVQISVSGRVTFVNSDRVFHEMQSDPHPEHTDCPEIGEVGALSPGQTKQTGVFRTTRACGYHDHGQDDNTSLQGTIIIR